MASKLNYIRLLPVILMKSVELLSSIFRYIFYYSSFKKIGLKVMISRNVSFGGIYNIELGNNVTINQGCNLYGDFGISIGDNTKLSPYVQLYSANYITKRENILGSLGIEGKKIIIGENVWIGAGSVILSGVKIGDNSIIGAGSVINKNIPPNEVWAGNPAKLIKSI